MEGIVIRGPECISVPYFPHTSHCQSPHQPMSNCVSEPFLSTVLSQYMQINSGFRVWTLARLLGHSPLWSCLNEILIR